MSQRIIKWTAFLAVLALHGRVAAAEAPVDPAGANAPVTLELVHAEIGDALRMLAKQGGINLVIGPDVKADISVSLAGISVRHALRAIVEGNGFRWNETQDIVTVTKPPTAGQGTESEVPLVTRVLRPRSVNAALLRDALQPALSKWGKLTVLSEDSKQGYGLGTFADGGTQPSGTTFRSASRSEVNVNAAPAGSAVPPGAAQANGQNTIQNSHILIVTDTAERIEQIARLVSELDVPPRQVLIEARIVEMSTQLQKQLGIDWNPEVFANGPILQHQFPLYERAGFAPGPINGLALGVVDFSRFTALVRAVQDDSAVRLLANPRMLVHNNHSASILVGEKYPLLTSTITDQGTTTEAFDSYIPVGVQLFVTPTIMSDGRVSLMVHPATSALGDDVVGTTGLRVARILTRELDTRAVVRDGDTIVLGGLISDRKANVVRKVPGLGDIPILDIVTRMERPRMERVDLLIFISVFVEGATDLSAEEKSVFNRYKPHFRHRDASDDVRLHFEFPFTQFYDREPPWSESDEKESGVTPLSAKQTIASGVRK